MKNNILKEAKCIRKEIASEKMRFLLIIICLMTIISLLIFTITSCGPRKEQPVSTNAEVSTTTLMQTTTVSSIVNILNGKPWVYMGGIDNTPVFKYSNNTIIQDRLDDFKGKAEKYSGTRFGDKLSEYLELLEDENYKYTQKVSDCIKNLTFY